MTNQDSLAAPKGQNIARGLFLYALDKIKIIHWVVFAPRKKKKKYVAVLFSQRYVNSDFFLLHNGNSY